MESVNLGPSILITVWILIGFSAVFLVTRLMCKFQVGRGLWWDDYVLLLSWLMLLGSIICVTVSVNKGLGKHMGDVPFENYAYIGLVGNITGSMSILAAVWSKTSFALTLLRLMDGRMKYFLWFIIISINIAMGLNASLEWARCSPPAKTWDFTVPGTCWDTLVYPHYGQFAAGYSAAMDFVLAMLPWKILWNLQMKKKEKLGVALAMSMGIFAGATAIVKTVEIPTIVSGDFTYASAPLVTWGSAESAVTIIAASIPVLRTLFRDLHHSNARYYGTGGSSSARGTKASYVSRGQEKDGVISIGMNDLRPMESHPSMRSSVPLRGSDGIHDDCDCTPVAGLDEVHHKGSEFEV